MPFYSKKSVLPAALLNGERMLAEVQVSYRVDRLINQHRALNDVQFRHEVQAVRLQSKLQLRHILQVNNRAALFSVTRKTYGR